MLNFSPGFVNEIYKSITVNNIEDYKLISTINRLEAKDLDSVGKDLFIDNEIPDKTETVPKKFDIRKAEMKARQVAGFGFVHNNRDLRKK